jgi:hypothetical protein
MVWAAKNSTFALPENKHTVSSFVHDISLYYDSITQKNYQSNSVFFLNNSLFFLRFADRASQYIYLSN